MTKTILASVATLFVMSTVSFATAPVQDDGIGAKTFDAGDMLDKRRKARVPGGSGCDSASDRREHKACRM